MSSPASSTSSRPAPAPAPRLLVPILVVGLLGGVFVLIAWPAPGTGGSRPPESAPPVTPAAGATAAARSVRRAEAEAAEVLRAWDRRRAEAWSAGDVAALGALYVPGASAGEADVAMLRDWTARGLAVDGLTTQLLGVRVLAHGPRRWRLLVRDRVAGAVASGEGFAEPMPAGATAEREVVLHHWSDGWRVASVRPTRRGAEQR